MSELERWFEQEKEGNDINFMILIFLKFKEDYGSKKIIYSLKFWPKTSLPH